LKDVYVVGVGMTKFGDFPIRPGVKELGEEACFKAMKDANVTSKDIEAGYCGIVAGIGGAQGPLTGNLAMKQVGVAGIPITRCENGCASSATAFREAWISVAAGLHDVVLILGIEKMAGLPTREMLKAMSQGSDMEIEGAMGMTFPGVFGMIALRHMHDYGTTREQLAMVSVKNHHNATMNPHAHYPKEVTIERVLNSPLIAYPLRLLDCCPVSDGASAAVIASEDVARRLTDTPLKIVAATQKSGTFMEKFKGSVFDITVRTVKEAYNMAKLEPKNIDLAEVHDCFTIAEILHNEDLGFFKKGEGGKAVEEGETEINGKVTINASGGLLAKGHPVGATGVAQICELVWQLRGEAGARQVDGAEIGLAHCMGNFSHADGGTCNVTILRR
jgi:acetyl-CoA C-acetyltransferase